MASTIKKAVLAASIALISFNAKATLTSYNSDGVDLVYSSVSNVTWTKDGNLLGSMFAIQGFNNVVNAIITASPTITNMPNVYSPSGNYNLSESDFSSDGSTTWFGAMGYIQYLNSISFGGISSWYLPTVVTTDAGYNPGTNGSAEGDEFAELFYGELSGTAGSAIPNTITFDNEQNLSYWSSTEATGFDSAWNFYSLDGFNDYDSKGLTFYAWAVTSGQISTVPEPDNLAIFLAGLGMVLLAVHVSKKVNRCHKTKGLDNPPSYNN